MNENSKDLKQDDKKAYSLEEHIARKMPCSLEDMKKEKPYDFVNPNHYKGNSVEVWEMMLKVWGAKKFVAFCEMNAFKYRMRLGLKPNQPIERDLEKATWYENKAKEIRDEYVVFD